MRSRTMAALRPTKHSATVSNSSMAEFALQGLASPGPLCYDTRGLDKRCVNTLAAAAALRANPLMGPPGAKGVYHRRFREDEARHVSARMARANCFSAIGPGPQYLLPSTYIAVAKPLYQRAHIQQFLPRSNAAHAPQGPGKLPQQRPQSASTMPRSASNQTIIGCARPRIRPASASHARRYSAYGSPHPVPAPSFRRPVSEQLAQSPPPPAQLQADGAVDGERDINRARQPLAARQPASMLASAGAPSNQRRARPQSASPPVVAWRTANVRGSHTTGIKLSPPGMAPPLRSAFVQPYGLNKLGL
jgi:hypothetical protein